MNILVLSNYFAEHIGGEELVAFNLVKNFRQLNHSVRWLAGSEGEHGANTPQDEIRIPIWNITEKTLGFPYPIIKPSALHNLVKHIQWADVVHIHDSLFLTSIYVGLVAKFLRKPVLLTQHISIIPYKEKYKIWLQIVGYHILARQLIEYADQVVFVSKHVKEWFERNFRLRLPGVIIYNGVDHQIFRYACEEERKEIRNSLNLDEDRPIILFVGRFTEKKGIKILKKVITKTPDLFWVMIGRPGGEDPFTWLFDNILVLSSKTQTELRKYYVAADLLVLPSVGEGFPLVVQESMMCGTPAVVSTEIANAISDLPALQVDVDEEAIISTIRNYFASSKNSQSQRTHVAQYAQSHWDWASTARQYEQILLRLSK